VSDPIFKFGGKIYNDLTEFGPYTMMPYAKFASLAADGSTFDITRAVFADAAGTATVVDAYGNSLAGFPLNKGENRICVKSITSLSGATKVWGAY
jgi:hypothetical protein